MVYIALNGSVRGFNRSRMDLFTKRYMYNKGLLNYLGNRQYNPNTAVTPDEFMSYVLYALGYRMKDGDYTLINAASLAKKRESPPSAPIST